MEYPTAFPATYKAESSRGYGTSWVHIQDISLSPEGDMSVWFHSNTDDELEQFTCWGKSEAECWNEFVKEYSLLGDGDV